MFLPDEDEIEVCKESLIERSRAARLRNGQIWVVTLYVRESSVMNRHRNLPVSEQKKVFQTTPRGFRKVILATGMAETGLTIDNITCVVDSGFETVLM